MNKKYTRCMSVLLALVLASTPVFACTATPKANLSRTEATQQDKPEAKKSGAFTVDNFKMITQALEKLGVSEDCLNQMIKEGKNLPEVLQTKEIEVKRFKKILIKEYYKVIKQGVEDEQLTPADAKMLKYAVKQKIMSWLSE